MIHTLSISDLTVSRGERLLFQGLDLRLQAGEAVVLTGANGAGKTSLLRAIAGLLRPDAGEVAFHDGDGNPLDERLARGRETHFLGHQDGLKTGRTARQELGFQCDWLGHVQCGMDDAVEAFGLAPLLDLEVRRLSAGQRRRLAMGRRGGAPPARLGPPVGGRKVCGASPCRAHPAPLRFAPLPGRGGRTKNAGCGRNGRPRFRTGAFFFAAATNFSPNCPV
ncbi:MAG: ATP-binding cassette domain-containing protein, partial [Brevundimonas sp.]